MIFVYIMLYIGMGVGTVAGLAYLGRWFSGVRDSVDDTWGLILIIWPVSILFTIVGFLSHYTVPIIERWIHLISRGD